MKTHCYLHDQTSSNFVCFKIISTVTFYWQHITKTVSKRSKFWSLLQCCVKNGFHVNPVQVTITKKKSEPLGPAYKIVGLAHFLINQPNSAMPQSFYSCNLSFFWWFLPYITATMWSLAFLKKTNCPLYKLWVRKQ